jgi:cytochrome oxidase Cu insertion factor (SCO1/SenC/PrrC family)
MKKPWFLLICILLIFYVSITACTENSENVDIVVGNPAPDFSLSESNGETISLSGYHGQPVLLFFHMAGG